LSGSDPDYKFGEVWNRKMAVSDLSSGSV